MKTYKTPHSSSLSTASAIEQTGENHLYSALNFGRVIAFTGSGSTMEYGRPSWADLVDTFIRLAVDNKKAILDGKTKPKQQRSESCHEEPEDEFLESLATLGSIVSQRKLENIWEEFERLFEASSSSNNYPEYKQIPAKLRHNADFTTSFLTLCEQIASWSKTNDDRERKQNKLNFRKSVADQFAKTELKEFYTATKQSIDQNADFTQQGSDEEAMALLKETFISHFIRHSDDTSSITRISSKATVAILCFTLAQSLSKDKPERTFNLEKLSLDSQDIYDQLINCLETTRVIDPLSEIYQGLGIKRYLTLNYDIEIERMLATHLANKQDKSHKEFCEFLKMPVNDKPPIRVRELRNGLQQAIRTSSIGKDNLGDLFTFGAFSSSFQSSIFHLHGRVDDPENMIITQLDYERLYLQSSNQRRSFEEARHAVFNGGDILFVGSGMKETDVIAPLKDFTARNRKLDDAPGRVYALILSSINPTCWESENTGLAQTLFKHYGVYTLFLDGPSVFSKRGLEYSNSTYDTDEQKKKGFRNARRWFSALLKTLDSKAVSASDLNNYCLTKLGNTLGNRDCLVQFEIDKQSEKTPPEIIARAINLTIEHLSKTPEVQLVEKAIQAVFKHSKNKLKALDNDEKSILHRLIIESEKRLKSKILQHKLVSLSRKRTEWWQDWEKRPKHRLAIYGDLKKTQGEPLVWVRHRADYHYDINNPEDLFSSLDTNSASTEPETSLSKSAGFYRRYFQQLKDATDDKEGASRIIRFTAPKGAGKGGLIKLLSEKITNSDAPNEYPFEYLFPNAGPGEKTHYAGGFFAHLTFTLEFTSTIFGLIRFIAKAADLEADKYLSASAISGFQQDRHSGIWLLKHALNKMADTEHRIFICLSGLFRLVDNEGDAYSPVHREFFRVITNTDSLKNAPKVDLLLFTRTQAKPIRYLSNEKPRSSAPDQEDEEKKYLLRSQVAIEQWPIFDPVNPQAVMRSALVSIKHDFEEEQFETQNITEGNTIGRFLPKESQLARSHVNSLNTFINKNVVHTYLLIGLLCWRAINRQSIASNEDSAINDIINKLNIAVGRAGATGFTRQIIAEYRVLDLAARKADIPESLVAPISITDVILKHLALFNHPVQPSVLIECPDLSMRLEQQINKGELVSNNIVAIKNEKEKILNSALKQLAAKRLIIKIKEGSKQKTKDSSKRYELRSRYSLHHEIAKVVTADMNYITQYTLSSAPYQATFYCAQAQARRGIPSSDHFHFVTRLLKHFISVLDYSLEKTRRNPAESENNILDFHECSALLRGAYAILRGSFSIGAISRLEIMELNYKQPYEAYRLWIQNIIHLSIRLSQYQDHLIQDKDKHKYGCLIHRLPTCNEERVIHNIYRLNPSEEEIRLRNNLPFYRDEVAWLYNEQAVVSFMQGKLYDAAALYNQALSVVRAQPEYTENQSVGAPKRRIEINLAIVKIERGEIHKAIDILDNAISEIIITTSSTTSMTLLYAKGYRALCDHLTGNLKQAKRGYKYVIKHVQKKRQLRATSIFQRHLADLYRIQGETEKANELLLFSEKAASQAQQEDILHYTLISKARLMRDLKSRSEALQILRRTEDYAKTMGLRKMLAEALKVRAEVMLAEGEVTQAGKMSAQAVAIFNRNGLRLRKISAAILQAKVYKKRGQIEFAEKILAEIEREASSLGYTLKSSSAQEDLHNLMSD